MHIELIQTSEGRVIAAQVGHHHISKSKTETEFKLRVKLFAENFKRLKEVK